ncbi:unnamed protein product, partial [Ascophyllum nodosum]
TAAKGSSGTVLSGDAGSTDMGRHGRKGGRMAEKDRFRLLQEAFYARGDLIVDIFQARGVSGASAGDRNLFCVVLVDREKVGETPVAIKTLSPMWNHPVKIPHESVRKAADTNVWPMPHQPLTIQVWDRSTTSDSLLGTARVPIAENLGDADRNGWHRLVGAGDQVKMDAEQWGKIRVKVRWESEAIASATMDEPRFFLRDVFGPEEKDYRHLYYGGLSSTLLSPPAGEEVILEMMSSISRHDTSANGHGRGVEGMLVLTELRLLFLPDVSGGLANTAFLEFHTVQVYLAAIRSFSHRGLEGGSRLLSITTRDGRAVHFRMPAAASAARCGVWFDVERRPRRQPAVGAGSGGEELWKRGLWGAGSSEVWMERLADEIRWRKAQGDFVALWHQLCKTAPTPRASAAKGAATLDPGAAPSAAPPSYFAASAGVDDPSASPGALSGWGHARAAAVENTRGDAADG